MTAERCCHRCKGLPGACARQRDCHCHAAYQDELKTRDWLRDAQEAAQRRAERAEQSRTESKRMSDWAAWR